MMKGMLRTTSTFFAVAWLAGPFALTLSTSGCALGGYGFDGYHALPAGGGSGGASAVGDVGASVGSGSGGTGGTSDDGGAPPSSGDASPPPGCILRTCAELKAECGQVPD